MKSFQKKFMCTIIFKMFFELIYNICHRVQEQMGFSLADDADLA